jgi:hypothetical protein
MTFSYPSFELPEMLIVAAVAFALGAAFGSYAVASFKQRQGK